MPTEQTPATPASSTPHPLVRKLLHVAWMSVLLGLVAQGVVIIILRTWPDTIVADLLSKITWSVIVCSALAIATTAGKASGRTAGLTGLLGAPAAVAAAKTVQKTAAAGVTSAATVAVVAPGAVELAILKAVQYAIFGWLICKAQKRGTLAAHLAVAVPIAIVFAAYLAWRTWSTTPEADLKPVVILAKAASDAAATIGCAIVLWAASAIASSRAVR